MNRAHDYDRLEKVFVAGDMSLRGLCAMEGIENHSSVAAFAKRNGWAQKRADFRAQAGAKFIDKASDAAAARSAKAVAVTDRAFDVIQVAFDRMIEDMQATKPVLVKVEGGVEEWREEPVFRLRPQDFGILVDKLNALLGRPGLVTEERTLGFSASADVAPDILAQLVELARGRAQPAAMGGNPLPRSTETDPRD